MLLEKMFARKGIITLSRELASDSGQNLSVRQLALHTGMSPSEASIVARKMKEFGIIRLDPVGKAFIVSLNKESCIWQRILKPILQAEAEIQGTEQASETLPNRTKYLMVNTLSNWLSQALQGYENKIISAVLYGDLKSELLTNVFLYIYFKEDYDYAPSIKKILSELDSTFNLRLDGLIGTPFAFWDDYYIKAKQVKNIKYKVLIGEDPEDWLRRQHPFIKRDPS